jgi:hypothetical protein
VEPIPAEPERRCRRSRRRGSRRSPESAARRAADAYPTVPSTERCDGVDNNCTGGVDEGAACPDGLRRRDARRTRLHVCSWEKGDHRHQEPNLAAGYRLLHDANVYAPRCHREREENQFVLDWIAA